MSNHYVVTGGTKAGFGQAITLKLLGAGNIVASSYTAADKDAAFTFREGLEPSLKDRLVLHEVNFHNRSSLRDFAQRSAAKVVNGFVNAHFEFEMENPEKMDFDLWERILYSNLTASNILEPVDIHLRNRSRTASQTKLR